MDIKRAAVVAGPARSSLGESSSQSWDTTLIFWVSEGGAEVVEGAGALKLLKMGFPDAVVWNIGAGKSAGDVRRCHVRAQVASVSLFLLLFHLISLLKEN